MSEVNDLPKMSAGTDRSDKQDGDRFLQQRLKSLDVYRGLIMISLAFTGFGLAATARNMLREQPDSSFWQTILFHFSHVEWVGCGYWDMIQPSFMFMVGVAMAFSYAKRASLGHSWGRMFLHALKRSLVLILLGIFLISNWQRSTNWSLMNVLSQIGLGYLFLFLLWRRHLLVQVGAMLLILVGTWYLYTSYADAGIDLRVGAADVGVSREWAQEHLVGIAPAWHKNANVGHAIDVWLLNLPRRAWHALAAQNIYLVPEPPPFHYNRGGYQTINFIPSLATMLLGLIAGETLRRRGRDWSKVSILLVVGLVTIAAGLALHYSGICPLVKRIWTPSWALFSGGICVLILSALFILIDVLKVAWWTFPFIVVGVNSIAIYCMSMLLKPWVIKTWKIHFGEHLFSQFGPYEPLVQYTTVGLTFWLFCLWMYRNKIFVRI